MLRGLDRLAALKRARGVEPDGEGAEFHLLPENLPVFRLWFAVQSQWAHGPMGPTGFNWQSLRAHPVVCRILRAEREEQLQGIADMESAWLATRARILASKASRPSLGG